jgi:flotillin
VREAEAACVLRKKEAEGLTELARAYGALAAVLGGPQGLLQLLMMQAGTYERLAAENAKAIQGLQPRINVWTTGGGGGDDGTAAADASLAPIRNLFKSLPPLFGAIQDQTGMTPPAWLVNMPRRAGVGGREERSGGGEKGGQMVLNGHGEE